jgi:hypothetical protein
MAHQGDGGALRLGHRHQAVDQTLRTMWIQLATG